MRAYYSDIFEFPLPDGHRFPIRKYTLLRERILESTLIGDPDLLVAPAVTDDEILRVHTSDYWNRLKHGELTAKELRRIGFPWSSELVIRSRHSAGGTLSACRAALEDDMGINLAGGTHHAHPDHGSGFCMLNDVAIASRAMQVEARAQRIVVLDCDVHQGDGTAAIFRDDPTVYTFSIHAEKNFPFHKQQSDLDIALPNDAGDDAYLDALSEGVQRALDAAHADLAIYLAGADPYIGDTFGWLALSKDGLAARDRMVMRFCRDADLPVAIVLSGGYARNIEDIVDIHYQTVRIAIEQSLRKD
jgi:acetoin utilization deacetylase AcuC-like enzyme